MIGEQVAIAARSLAVLMLLTGVAYPMAITGLAQTVFPHQANGSILVRDGTAVGSKLIGQPFSDPKYFWGRLSATSPAYNASASSGSNLGPTNPVLIAAVKARVEALRRADPTNVAPVPVDLVAASASGLDPHISLAAAAYQLPRVARVRGLRESTVQTVVARATEGRFLGVLGEPVVNVLAANRSLDDVSR